MELHLLLTSDIKATMPKSTKIKHNFGQLEVIFDGPHDYRNGLHCVVEDTKEHIIEWLKPFAGFVKGNGIPQCEEFEICHIK
jgi:hypothetical protein